MCIIPYEKYFKFRSILVFNRCLVFETEKLKVSKTQLKVNLLQQFFVPTEAATRGVL